VGNKSGYLMNCLHCGVTSDRKAHNAIYCSERCKQKSWRSKRGDIMRAQWRKYHRSETGVITKLLNYARDRSRSEGVFFDLDREWLKQKLDRGVCEVTGLRYQNIAPGDYRTHPYAPSLDRIKAGGPYTKDNVRLVLFGINRAMSDWGEEVLLVMARAMVEKAATS
jgi:hypothetical protein